MALILLLEAAEASSQTLYWWGTYSAPLPVAARLPPPLPQCFFFTSFSHRYITTIPQHRDGGFFFKTLNASLCVRMLLTWSENVDRRLRRFYKGDVRFDRRVRREERSYGARRRAFAWFKLCRVVRSLMVVTGI